MDRLVRPSRRLHPGALSDVSRAWHLLMGRDSGVGRREALDVSQLGRQRDGGDSSGNDGGSGGSSTGVTDGGAGSGFDGSTQMAWAADKQAALPSADAAGRGSQSIGGSGRTGSSTQNAVAAAADSSAAADVTGQRKQEAARRRELLAVLVPYRDRAEQLSVFVRHMRAHLLAQGMYACRCSEPILKVKAAERSNQRLRAAHASSSW